MDHGLKLHPDGTLEITLPQGTKVGRVLVCEAGTQNGSLYYPESDVPDATDCTDCIKHGGDWECDRVRCRKGTKQQATKASDCISRQAVSSWLKQYGQDVLHGKYKFSLMYIWKNLMDLPSAQPERKTGCWRYYERILKCSECNVEIYDDIMELLGDDVPKYCPVCGSYNGGDENRENSHTV